MPGPEAPSGEFVVADGDMPLEWRIGLLPDSGYRGFFEIATIGPNIHKEGYPESIHHGAAWLSERLARWGV